MARDAQLASPRAAQPCRFPKGCPEAPHLLRYGPVVASPLPIVERIPADVRRFVLTSIPTVPHLEALLLLHRAPQEHWRAATLARRLYIGVDAAARLLADLAERGLSERLGDEFRFPQDDELAALVAAVEAAYSAQLVELSRLIHSRTDRKAQQFADAFEWKKDDSK
jgi:hypothetical protein